MRGKNTSTYWLANDRHDAAPGVNDITISLVKCDHTNIDALFIFSAINFSPIAGMCYTRDTGFWMHPEAINVVATQNSTTTAKKTIGFIHAHPLSSTCEYIVDYFSILPEFRHTSQRLAARMINEITAQVYSRDRDAIIYFKVDGPRSLPITPLVSARYVIANTLSSQLQPPGLNLNLVRNSDASTKKCLLDAVKPYLSRLQLEASIILQADSIVVGYHPVTSFRPEFNPQYNVLIMIDFLRRPTCEHDAVSSSCPCPCDDCVLSAVARHYRLDHHDDDDMADHLRRYWCILPDQASLYSAYPHHSHCKRWAWSTGNTYNWYATSLAIEDYRRKHGHDIIDANVELPG
jgi:hypothetical protein